VSPNFTFVPNQRRIPVGNPADAPAVFGSLGKQGNAARAGVVVWLISFVVALSVGVLFGVAGSHHGADKRMFDWMTVALGGVVICLVPLGTYLAYRGTGGFPRGWAEDR
jgi:hypothetical protein